MRALLGILLGICTFIAHLLATVCKALYHVLKVLRIRILTLYLIVCGIVQLIWGCFSTGDGILYFWLGFTGCVLITVFSWIYAFHKQNARRNAERQQQEAKKRQKQLDKKKKKIEKRQEKEKQKQNKKSPELLPEAPGTAHQTYPVYFEAAGHPGYIFAEYEDRYELYRQDNGKLVYLRTDKKTGDKK